MPFGSHGSFSDVIDGNYISSVITVGTSAVAARVGGSNLTNRQELIIFNDSSSTIYYGPSGVTTSGSTKGIPIHPGGFVNLPFGQDIDVYLISASAGNSIIVQELG